MKTPRRCAPILCLAGLLAGLSCRAAAQELDPAEAPGEPSISLRQVGPVEVEGERRIVLAEAVAELTGEVWNYHDEDEVAVLLKPVGAASWSVAAASPAEPGGLFRVSGIRFPDTGDYELVAGLFPAGNLEIGGEVSEKRWRIGSRALSRKHLVRVTSPPPPLERDRPTLAVLSVGDASLDSRLATPVLALGDVTLRAQGLRPGSRVYLAIVAPYSDRCFLHGPAARETAQGGAQPDAYFLPGVSLEVPGDPRHSRLELFAVASDEPLAAGPMSRRLLLRRKLAISRTVEVVVDDKSPVTNSRRVPWIAITRIGMHTLDGAEPPDRTLPVEPGDLVEVGRNQRVPEGARLWVLTRPRWSSFWLVQGPAPLRGAPSGDDPGQGPPEPMWVWPSARFENAEPGGRAAEQGRTSEEFEVMAVLSTTAPPGPWIHTSSLADAVNLTISPVVRVSLRPRAPLPHLEVSLSRIGGKDTDPEEEASVGAVERVEVGTRQELPTPLRIYVARHPIGSSVWSLSEAASQGKSHIVPGLPFTNPHAEEGAQYQLIAVATPGVLPAEQREMEWDDLVHAAVARSEIITVRYRSGATAGVGRRGSENAPTKRRTIMEWSWAPLLWILGGLALLAVLAAFQWRFGLMAPLAGKAADRIERGLRQSNTWFTPPKEINPATFLLGVILLVLVLFVIVEYYLPLYAEAVEVVTSLPRKESAGLAMWLVLVTAFAGILLEQATVPSQGREGFRIVLCLFLGLALAGLIVFQGLFYFTFLQTMSGDMVPLLGGIVFSLIALVEATVFFFISRQTLEPAGAFAVRLGRSPLVLTVLLFRSLEKFLHGLPKRAQCKDKRQGEQSRREQDKEEQQ